VRGIWHSLLSYSQKTGEKYDLKFINLLDLKIDVEDKMREEGLGLSKQEKEK